jgi:hypothetical protein
MLCYTIICCVYSVHYLPRSAFVVCHCSPHVSYCKHVFSLSDIIGGYYSFQMWLIMKSYCEKLFYLSSTDTSHFGCELIQKRV